MWHIAVMLVVQCCRCVTSTSSYSAASSLQSPVGKCTLPIVKIGPKGLNSKRSFNRRYRGKSPVIFENATSGWSAHRLWRKGGFLKIFGNLQLQARPELTPGEGIDVGISNVSVDSYLTDDAHSENILFDFGNYDVHRSLVPYCSPTPKPLLQIRLTTAFSLGRRGAGSGAHQHEENWMSQIVGRKVWILAPPKSEHGLPPGIRPCEFLNDYALPQDAMLCEVGEGQTLYLPDRWHHATCNLDNITVGVGGKGDSADWPLYLFAIQDGDVDSLRQAKEAGVDIVSGDKGASDGAMALAAMAGDLTVLDYLLEQGADPMERFGSGERPAHLAAYNGHIAVLERLHGWSKDALLQKDNIGNEPVFYAARQGHSPVVSFLLSQRASPSAVEQDGATLSHFAAGAGQPPMLQALLEHRAEVDVTQGNGNCPLHWASRNGHVDAVRWLVEANAAINRKGNDDMLPVHWASYSGGKNYREIFEILLQGRANIHAADARGAQPLHWAAQMGAGALVKRLLELKVDSQVMLNQDLPIDIARTAGHHEVVKLLETKRRRKAITNRGGHGDL